jgi:ADP-ribose pyrophosphatase
VIHPDKVLHVGKDLQDLTEVRFKEIQQAYEARIEIQTTRVEWQRMKIIDSTVIKKSKFVNLVAVAYEDRKGNGKRWHMVTREAQPKCITGNIERPDATIIVPYHRRENKLVVIKEFRVPVGGYMVGFPAGLLDPDEAPETAAGRELHEETGLDLVRIYRHSPAVFSSAGITDEAISMVFAEVDGKPSRRLNEDSEDITVYLMDREAVQALVQRQDIAFGARAWLVMDAYSRFGRGYLTGE